MEAKFLIDETQHQIQRKKTFFYFSNNKCEMDWICAPLDSFHSSLDENTPVAKIVSLQITPLYGL